MAQTATQGDRHWLAGRQTAKPRLECLFFSGMAALILVSVLVGFAQSYYLLRVPTSPAGRCSMFRHTLIVHLHGILFTSWILLLITQTSLVAAHRIKVHRRLGIAGFVLACLLSLLGLAVVCESMARHAPFGHPGIVDQSVAILNVLGFGILTYFGYRQRGAQVRTNA